MRTIEEVIDQHVGINPTNTDEWAQIIKDKVAVFGNTKINLCADGESEGVWAVFASQTDLDEYKSNLDGFAVVYLLNYPLTFGFWGMPLIVKLNGETRPESFSPKEIKKHPKLVEEIDRLFELRKRDA